MDHKFNSVNDIAEAIGVSRVTMYKRAKREGIDVAKKEFTEQEWKSLSLTSKVNKSVNVNTSKVGGINKVNTENSVINQLKKQVEAQEEQMKFLRDQLVAKDEHLVQQLAVKDEQIKEKDKQLDQAQRLQLDLQQQLKERQLELTTIEEETEPEPQKRKWWRFGK